MPFIFKNAGRSGKFHSIASRLLGPVQGLIGSLNYLFDGAVARRRLRQAVLTGNIERSYSLRASSSTRQPAGLGAPSSPCASAKALGEAYLARHPLRVVLVGTTSSAAPILSVRIRNVATSMTEPQQLEVGHNLLGSLPRKQMKPSPPTRCQAATARNGGDFAGHHPQYLIASVVAPWCR